MQTVSPDSLSIVITFSLGLILGLGIGIIGILLGKIISPFKEFPRKRERYECANPPRGRARGLLMMQYYPYLILFLTIEPIMIYSFLLLLESHVYPSFTLLLFLGILGIIIPPLIFGLHSARRLELWSAP
ncbi:MAG: NADH-quinone oxidoreductase subunit A [Candidatus Korarchaeum sp.]|nr:NADH-quinone oxidoreductase subunit A [Candidatus Korarchaeum sp.]